MPMLLHMKSVKGKPFPRGNEHYWSIVQEFARRDATFTMANILAASVGARVGVPQFFKRFEEAGILVRVSAEGEEPVFKTSLIQSVTPRIRADGSVITGVSKQQALWNAMRSPTSRQGFTIQELAVWASTDDAQVSLVTSGKFVRLLAAAGYLIEVAPQRRGTAAVWRLDPRMNTGPMTPMLLATRVVFDQNRRIVMSDVVAAEECA